MQNECKNSAFFIYLFFNAISTRVASCLFNVISSARVVLCAATTASMNIAFGLSRRVVLCSAATVSMIIVFGLSRADVRGAERRKQPKAARHSSSPWLTHGIRQTFAPLGMTTYGLNQLFGCNAQSPSKQTHGIRQAFGLPTRNDGIKSYLFGCNAKPPPQPTHGIRQAFGLHTAFAKPLACSARNDVCVPRRGVHDCAKRHVIKISCRAYNNSIDFRARV